MSEPPRTGAVTQNAPERRFEITVGGRLAGFIQYRRDGDVLDLFHTETQPGFEGQGLATKLIHDTLETLAARQQRFRPTCPFVREYVDSHPELDRLVDRSGPTSR